MCEKRARKVKKGSQLTRLREARRLQRLQWLASPVSTSDESNSSQPCTAPCTAPCAAPCAPQVDKFAQNRVILELAWKTIGLMHKNRLIQQKIIALQKETSEFVASIMRNPENRQRYLEHVRLYNIAKAQAQARAQAGAASDNQNMPLKVEPNV